jgi:hypothetical protein
LYYTCEGWAPFRVALNFKRQHNSCVQKKSPDPILIVALACLALTTASSGQALAWSNGGYSANPADQDYGTHDWIAQHALDWLPAQEKQFFESYLASYLYGTELPDNANTPEGVGDTAKHHVYFCANGSLQDDASAVRAQQEYANAQVSFAAGNLSAAAEHLGMVTHYVADLAVFGHVMGAPTAWDAENHHSDYEDYVFARTESYTSSSFDGYLLFDGSLMCESAYDAAVAVARDTAFDGAEGLTCTWMDTHYNWSDPAFKSRCGESLNLATNTMADVLHTFYLEAMAPAVTPTPTAIDTAQPTPTITPTASPTPTPKQTPTASPQVPEFPSEVALILLFAASATLVVYRHKKIAG